MRQHHSLNLIAAYKMALINRGICKDLIFHSDRGVQYASEEFRELLGKGNMVVQSMSRKGNCWDNAVAESFFKSLKSEWLDGKVFKTRRQAELEVFHYIEIWYNRSRLHSTLGYKSPEEYLAIQAKKGVAAWNQNPQHSIQLHFTTAKASDGKCITKRTCPRGERKKQSLKPKSKVLKIKIILLHRPFYCCNSKTHGRKHVRSKKEIQARLQGQ